MNTSSTTADGRRAVAEAFIRVRGRAALRRLIADLQTGRDIADIARELSVPYSLAEQWRGAFGAVVCEWRPAPDVVTLSEAPPRRIGRRFYCFYADDPEGEAALRGEIHHQLQEYIDRDDRHDSAHYDAESMYRDLIGCSKWEGDELIVTIDSAGRLEVVGHAFPGDTTPRPLDEWLQELQRLDLLNTRT